MGQMYRELVGAYPYSKFAVVENFWESGLGMPSFTLLGPRVIRLPFVWKSSLPHEIAHNWWGNGVFVDMRRGNWSEGLTAYLADHLIKEQRGQRPEHQVEKTESAGSILRIGHLHGRAGRQDHQRRGPAWTAGRYDHRVHCRSWLSPGRARLLAENEPS